MPLKNDFLEELLRLAGLGALGGLARYLQLTYLQTKVLEFGSLAATMLIGAVCGVTLGWICGAVKPDWQNISAVISGVLGLQIIYLVAGVGAKIVGKSYGVEVREIDLADEPKTRVRRKTEEK